MKKLTVSLIGLCVVMIQACGKDNQSNGPIFTNDTTNIIKPLKVDSLPKKDDKSIRGMCIFFTQTGNFTEADWSAVAASNCTDFFLIPKDAGNYGSNAEGYVANLTPLMVRCINQLTAKRSNAKIWIGTPGISSLNYNTLSGNSLDPIVSYINSVRTSVGETVWSNNIRGVYMNCESIYGDLGEENIFANPTVKLMSDLSTAIRTNMKKEFLWIPYYGYGVNSDQIIRKIAFVTCDQTIFDYVVIQPHYYFDGNYESNLYGIRSSIIKRTICMNNGKIVRPKLSTTIIGAEMELDWHIVAPSAYTEYVNRYKGYVNSFGDMLITNVPLIFYWDGNVQNALTSRINPFFQ